MNNHCQFCSFSVNFDWWQILGSVLCLRLFFMALYYNFLVWNNVWDSGHICAVCLSWFTWVVVDKLAVWIYKWKYAVKHFIPTQSDNLWSVCVRRASDLIKIWSRCQRMAPHSANHCHKAEYVGVRDGRRYSSGSDNRIVCLRWWCLGV